MTRYIESTRKRPRLEAPPGLTFQELLTKAEQDSNFSQLEEKTKERLYTFIAQLPRINADILHRPLTRDTLLGARIRFLTFARKHNLATVLSKSEQLQREFSPLKKLSPTKQNPQERPDLFLPSKKQLAIKIRVMIENERIKCIRELAEASEEVVKERPLITLGQYLSKNPINCMRITGIL